MIVHEDCLVLVIAVIDCRILIQGISDYLATETSKQQVQVAKLAKMFVACC